MAYNEENLTKLKSLKQLAERVKQDFATKASVSALEERVDGLVTAGGEPNVITAVKVNGAALPVEGKAVDVTVPTKVSELANDAKYQTESEVGAAIQTAIAATGHATFERAEAVPQAEDAKDNVLYLVMNEGTGHYDIYAKVSGEVVLLDDVTVDLSGYVAKEDGKGLSANDFTDALLEKLNGIAQGATKVEAEEGSGVLTIDGTAVTLFHVATDAEVAEMLTEVFDAQAS